MAEARKSALRWPSHALGPIGPQAEQPQRFFAGFLSGITFADTPAARALFLSASFRSIGMPCFFRRSANASSASS